MKRIFAILLSISVLSSCGHYSRWSDTELPGPIYPGTPAEIIGIWHSHYDYAKYYGPMVYELYLYTRQNKPGAQIERHKASAATFRSHPVGSTIRWKGDDVDSTVEDRKYNKENYYANGYLLAFEVKQCRDRCHIGYVQVNPKTWLKYSRYDWITFAGDPNKDIRD